MAFVVQYNMGEVLYGKLYLKKFLEVLLMKGNKLTAVFMSAAMLSTAMISSLSFAAPVSAATEAKVIYSNDFEDGNVSDFSGRGGVETIAAVTDKAYSGEKSMCVSNREKSWNGPQFAVEAYCEAGVEYTVSAAVCAEWYNNINMSMEYTDAGGTRHYSNLQSVVSQGEWQTFEDVKFSFNDDVSSVYIYFECNDTAKIYVDDFVLKSAAVYDIQEDIVSLKDVYADYFKIGTACTAAELAPQTTKNLILKHFNSITAGNEMKPDSVLNKAACQAYVEETGDDTVPQISFGAAKPLLNYCRNNNVPMRIHTLVWHSQTPDWFFKENYADDGEWVSKEKMLLRMENYIKVFFETLTELYPTVDFYACDVVNEAWLEDGKPRQPGEQGSGGSAKSAWVQVFGDNSFIEPAFTYARKYAPEGCKLYYNDYNEYMDGKMNAIIDMAKDLKEKGVIDGIGMQSHLDARQSLDAAFPSVAMYNNALDKYSELGLDIQVTELDVTTPENPKDADFAVQAAYYEGIWDAIYAHKDNISAVILWGVTDDQSWRAKQHPLLFDAEYKAKECFKSIVDGYEMPDVIPTNPPVTPTEPTTKPTTEPKHTTHDTEVTVYGDANCDGVVTIADAAAIFQNLAKYDKYKL